MKTITDLCVEKLNFLNIALGKEYNYSCLPLAVIDTVYSIQLNYKTVEKIVDRYCKYYGIAKYKNNSDNIHTISDLIENINAEGVEKFASDVLKSKNKTAGLNKISKAQAVLEWSEILKGNGIETFDDFNKIASEQLEKELKKVKGQGKAAVKYLFMLCGNKNFCKPDRHIINFFSNILNRTVNQLEIQDIMESIVRDLKNKNVDITLRQLDYVIWKYQKSL